MGRIGRRTLAVGALAAGAGAAYLAVVSALGSPGPGAQPAQAADAATTSRTVAFPGARVVVRVRDGLACYRVAVGTSTVARACASGLADDEISYAASRHAVGGLAGPKVRAVIVKLTRKGTTWATLRKGAFLARVPKGYRPRTVIKVLAGGARESFAVRASR